MVDNVHVLEWNVCTVLWYPEVVFSSHGINLKLIYSIESQAYVFHIISLISLMTCML